MVLKLIGWSVTILPPSLGGGTFVILNLIQNLSVIVLLWSHPSATVGMTEYAAHCHGWRPTRFPVASWRSLAPSDAVSGHAVSGRGRLRTLRL